VFLRYPMGCICVMVPYVMCACSSGALCDVCVFSWCRSVTCRRGGSDYSKYVMCLSIILLFGCAHDGYDDVQQLVLMWRP